MITKYDSGDEVLIPVKIKTALGGGERIMYYIQGLKTDDGYELLVPETMIEGYANIGKEEGMRLFNKIVAPEE